LSWLSLGLFPCFTRLGLPVGDLKLADWAAISEIALVVIAALALLGAGLQVWQARAAARETLTYNFTHRFSHPEVLCYHQRTSDLFDLAAKETTAEERWLEFHAWKVEDRIAALLLPNLIEEMAGMYNEGLLHKRITKDFFGYTALDFWELGWWFISRTRLSHRNYYCQWEAMLEDMDLLLPTGLVPGGARPSGG
jgi:hypothetical protein